MSLSAVTALERTGGGTLVSTIISVSSGRTSYINAAAEEEAEEEEGGKMSWSP